MNFIPRIRAPSAGTTRLGMLEAMIKRLYIRRFPQSEEAQAADDAERATPTAARKPRRTRTKTKN